MRVIGLGETYSPKCGHAYPKDSSADKGTWEVYFPNQISEISEYFFLDNGTDYDYYSAVYSCRESEIGPIEQDGIILTRYKHPSFSQAIRIHEISI